MVTEEFQFEQVDLSIKNHREALLSLMNDYMMDDMGMNAPLSINLGEKIIKGLKEQNNYLGFLLKYQGEYVSLANCFRAFSTFKAKPLINIHDFIVTPLHRKIGAGKAMLDAIAMYGEQNGFCKVTLEVRNDNEKAQRLYKKCGFVDCDPPMYFWQKTLNG